MGVVGLQVGRNTLRRALPVATGAVVGILWSFPSAFTSGALPVSLNQTTASPNYTTNYSQAAFENTGTTYYVAATGSDTTGDGSSGLPWRTIQKAVDTAATGSKISVGAGRFPNITIASKNLSVYGVAGSTFVGDFLTNADVTSWGTTSSIGQVITLATGALSGFIDLIQTRRIDGQGNPIPQVSQAVASAAAITTAHNAMTTAIELALYGTAIGSADPQAAIYRNTGRTAASDGRDLTNKFDTELIAWRATSARPLALSGTSQVFAKGITFVGGANGIQAVAGTRLVLDNCSSLGSHTQQVDQDGGFVAYRTVFRGCAAAGSDLVDYGSAGTTSLSNYGLELESFFDQCGATGADNCSTQHNGTTLRVNSTYLDASRCWSDIGQSMIGGYGCTVGAAPTTSNYSINVADAEGHFAGIRFITTGAIDIRVTQGTPATAFTRGYFYDTSYVGRSITGAVTDRSGSKPTGDGTFIRLDATDLTKLFKDTARTQPVTTVGDNVAAINSALSSNDYVTVTAGTLTYQLDGSLPCLVSGTANALVLTAFFNDALMEESCNFILGLKSSDTSGYLVKWGSGTANTAGSFAATTTSPTGTPTLSPGRTPGNPTYNVDGSNTGLTTGNALKAAAFNGSPHVLTMRNINMQWLGYYRTGYLMNNFDGTIYGIEISRVVDAATTRTHEQAMAAKSGVTVP